ncbi:GNAT family N-acetyltransferase [Bradyrhizobium sp. TZ2]
MSLKESPLLRELAGRPDAAPPQGWQAVFNRLADEPEAGAIFVSIDEDDQIVGLITLGISEAIRVGGRYATIQELWVHRNYRGSSIGASLVREALAYCEERNLDRVEVGLPSITFPAIRQVEEFYKAAGFDTVGPRMRCFVKSERMKALDHVHRNGQKRSER